MTFTYISGVCTLFQVTNYFDRDGVRIWKLVEAAQYKPQPIEVTVVTSDREPAELTLNQFFYGRYDSATKAVIISNFHEGQLIGESSTIAPEKPIG